MKTNDIFAGRYRLTRHMGDGGFAQVWQAEDQMAEDAVVAVKIYAPDRGLDENGVKIFRKEFALTIPLNHPHLLKSFHFDVYQGSPYLIMPLCREGSLMTRVVDEYAFSEKEMAQVLHQISDGMAYLHKKGICHQDIKPDNVLIMEPDHYVLSDFGISSKTRRTLVKSMRAEQAQSYSAFTPAYAPPEKYTSKPSPAGDVFSLGVTLYELATHDVPFADIGMALKEGAGIPDLPPSYSRPLNDLLKACMALDQAKRPTASGLQKQAAQYLQSGNWPSPKSPGVKPRRETQRMPEPPAMPSRATKRTSKKTDPSPKKTVAPKKKRNLLPIIGGILFVLFVVGKYGWEAYQESKRRDTRAQFYLLHQSELTQSGTLEDSILAFQNALARAKEIPYSEVIDNVNSIELQLGIAESKKTRLEELAQKKPLLSPLEDIQIGVSSGLDKKPGISDRYASLLNAEANCKNPILSISRGKLSGLGPKASQEEVKKRFPCYTELVTFTEAPLNAKVWYEKQQFQFSSSRQAIEVYRYFTGSMDIPLMEKSEQEVMNLLGKQPVKKQGAVLGYQDYVFQMEYGTLVAGFANNHCARIYIYNFPPSLIPHKTGL